MDDEEYLKELLGPDTRSWELVDGIAWRYNVNDMSATLVAGPQDECAAEPCRGKLKIPHSLGGFPVRGIGSKAFLCMGCYDFIDALDIPSCVEHVGRNILPANSRAQEVRKGLLCVGNWCVGRSAEIQRNPIRIEPKDIGYGVVGIAEGVFYGSSFWDVRLPASVRYLCSECISGCKNLNDVYIPYGVEVVEPGVFSGCSALRWFHLERAVPRMTEDAFRSVSREMCFVVGRDWDGPRDVYLGREVVDEFEYSHRSCPIKRGFVHKYGSREAA